MIYSKEVYYLYTKIALKAHDLGYGPLRDCFLHFTPLFTRIAHTNDKDPNTQFEELFKKIDSVGSSKCEEITELIYKFFINIQELGFPKEPSGLVGVFYTIYYPKFKNLAIHFYLPPDLKSSPFLIQSLNQRQYELKELFKKARIDYPQAERVRGFSWLHNMDFYKRIFPTFYYNKGTISAKDYYGSNAYWGQFVNRDGSCRKDSANKFLNCLDTKKNLATLTECFPLKGLEVICDIKYFYDFYGV